MRHPVVAVTSMVFLTAALSHSAEPIGRFFFTPAQRAQLDTMRDQHRRGIVTQEPTESAPPPEIVTYSGMVRRSDGKSTVWINNSPVHGREASGVAIERLRPDGAVTLKVPQTNRDVQLKVGQSVDVVSGTIEEPFDRRIAAPKTGPESMNPARSTDAATTKTKTNSQGTAKVPDTGNGADNMRATGTKARGASNPPAAAGKHD